MDFGLPSPTYYAPELGQGALRRQLGSTGWEEASPRSQRGFILKSNAMERCQVPPFPCPMSHRHSSTLDATAIRASGPRALHLKVWSWAKGTPQTKMLGESKDSLRFCLLSKHSTKKLSWDAQGLYFPRLCSTCSHKGMFLTFSLVPQVYESSPELPKRKPQGFKFPGVLTGVLRQRRGDFELAYPVTGSSELF